MSSAPASSSGIRSCGPLRTRRGRRMSGGERTRRSRQVTDAEADPDRRAWHRALAARVLMTAVADELEHSAARARARAGQAAAAAFLERSVALTLDPKFRAERALAAAEAKYLAGSEEDALRLAEVAERRALDEHRACARWRAARSGGDDAAPPARRAASSCSARPSGSNGSTDRCRARHLPRRVHRRHRGGTLGRGYRFARGRGRNTFGGAIDRSSERHRRAARRGRPAHRRWLGDGR